MLRAKPHVVVFFGGSTDTHELSQETGYWACQYLPRGNVTVTPVHVTPDGQWQVPLGSLPEHGPVTRMLDMLFNGITPLPPVQALQRLLRQPVQAFMTMLRGRGGDDGSLHSLGATLNIPVVGSGASTCHQTYDKHLCAHQIDDIVSTPFTLQFSQSEDEDSVMTDIRQELVPPLFIKPAAHEGSTGVEEVHSLDELAAAVHGARKVGGNFLAQERQGGQELNVTLIENAQGRIQVLPPTLITPQKTSFYDRMAKHRPGRVALHTSETALSEPLFLELETIVRDVYTKLNCRGFASLDIMVNDDVVDLLEVNTIPTLTRLTPFAQQLRTAGIHPTTFLHALVNRSLGDGF